MSFIGENFIEKRKLEELIDFKQSILHVYPGSISGNIHLHELVAIGALIQYLQPLNLLEIGTFIGNTTLQMALNAPEDAIVHTLDLPPKLIRTKNRLLEGDLEFIEHPLKVRKHYHHSKAGDKIREHYGDSGEFDFSVFVKNRPLDFIFIDGSHSYESVSCDTYNALKYIGKNGMILWHDFSPEWAEVHRFLCELDCRLPLIHIEGSTLVLYHHRQEIDLKRLEQLRVSFSDIKRQKSAEIS